MCFFFTNRWSGVSLKKKKLKVSRILKEAGSVCMHVESVSTNHYATINTNTFSFRSGKCSQTGLATRHSKQP